MREREKSRERVLWLPMMRLDQDR